VTIIIADMFQCDFRMTYLFRWILSL